jgi:hypothetical protein
MNRTWKLVPFAAIAALGVLALFSGSAGRVSVVESAPSFAPSLSATSVTSGESITVTAIFDTDEQAVRVRAVNAGTGVSVTSLTLQSATHSPLGNVTAFLTDTNAAADVFETNPAALDDTGTANPLSIGLTATITCTAAGSVQFESSQPVGEGALTSFEVQCAPTTPTPTGTVSPTTTATVTPTVTGTPSAAHTITVSAAPQTLGCQGSAFITAVVRTEGGANVADGTQVVLTTSLGSISPSTAATLGGGVLAVLTAPANEGGTATITATSGTVTGQTTVQINCAQQTPTPIPPTATPVPPTGIAPPATGDAGLLSSGPGTYVGVILLMIAALGSIAVVRQRA